MVYNVHCTIHKLERKVVCNITPFVSAEEPFLPLFNKPVSHINLKGVFAKNERGYRLNAIKKRF